MTGHAWGWFFQYPNPKTHPPGVALGVGVTVGVAEGVGVGLGVTDGVGVVVGVAVGVAVGVTLGDTLGLGVGVGLPSARAVSTVLVFPVTPSNPAMTMRRFPIAVPPVNACATFVFGPLAHVLLVIS